MPAMLNRLPIATIALLSLLALTSTGCQTEIPDPTPRVAVIEREVNVPPRQMLDIARRAVTGGARNLGVESEAKGSIVTGWEPHPGEIHIARRWQERTRYRVTIIPDWDQPDAKSRVQVVQETQTRAANGQTWKPASHLVRSGRAQKLLDEIVATVPQADAAR